MVIPDLFEPLTETEIKQLHNEIKINPKLIPILFDYYNQDRYLVKLLEINRKSFLISFECWLMTD